MDIKGGKYGFSYVTSILSFIIKISSAGEDNFTTTEDVIAASISLVVSIVGTLCLGPISGPVASALADTPRLKTVHRTVFFTAVSITFHSKNIRVPQGYS